MRAVAGGRLDLGVVWCRRRPEERGLRIRPLQPRGKRGEMRLKSSTSRIVHTVVHAKKNHDPLWPVRIDVARKAGEAQVRAVSADPCVP